MVVRENGIPGNKGEERGLSNVKTTLLKLSQKQSSINIGELLGDE